MSDAPKRETPSSHLSRRGFLQRAGLGALGLGLGGRQVFSDATTDPGQNASRPPNVLMLMSDEHHANFTSATGHPTVQTPNMARLAAMGTVYDNTYCISPLCSPSRSSFMCGLRPHQTQWYSNCNVFERNFPTYGAVLAEQGVHTVFVGKTDIYERHGKFGFNEVLLPAERQRPGDRSIQRNPLFIPKGEAARAKAYGTSNPDPFGADIKKVDAAVNWLNTQGPAQTGPWYMGVHLLKPHFPHYVTQDLWDMYPNGGDLPAYDNTQPSANHPRALDLRRFFETDLFTEDQIRGLRRGYLGCVTFIDQQLGRILDALETSGQLANTVVIYTSDHGEMLGKFGMWWKSSMYDDSSRIPLIVSGPGYAKGARVKTPVSAFDLQASFFRTFNAKRPDGWSGSPLQDVPVNDPTRVVISEYHGHGTRASSFLVRRGDMKLIYHVDAPTQLFDLGQDPQELTNLADQQPAVVADLTAELKKLCDPEVENQRAEAMINSELAALGPMKNGGGEES